MFNHFGTFFSSSKSLAEHTDTASTSTLMRLLNHTPRLIARTDRNLPLQRATSTSRFRLRGEFLQRVHCDAVGEGRFVACVEEDSVWRRGRMLVCMIGEGLAECTHFGTTGSSLLFAASIASFHRAVHRHHLQPGSRPMLRRLLPREAEKSRNSLVRTPG